MQIKLRFKKKKKKPRKALSVKETRKDFDAEYVWYPSFNIPSLTFR
jgi:hypothetical protein